MLRVLESLYSLCGIEANMRVGVSHDLKTGETTVCSEEQGDAKRKDQVFWDDVCLDMMSSRHAERQFAM